MFNETQSSILKREVGMKEIKMTKFEKMMLLKKISEMDNLPSPGKSVIKISQLLRDESATVPIIVAEIEKDQTLVSSILKLINSGFYSMRNTIESVGHAVNLLGLQNVKQLVYSASVMDFFDKDQKIDWEHSYSSSVLMAQLIKENELPVSETLSIAMLMHDLGKVVLQLFNPKKYAMVREAATREDIPIWQAEEKIFKINHAEVAEIILEKWDMDKSIITAISMHHNYTELPEEEYILDLALIQFVNWVDSSARAIPCVYPSKALLEASGLGELDRGYWMRFQKDSIEKINKEGE